jgi:hypothetical protein
MLSDALLSIYRSAASAANFEVLIDIADAALLRLLEDL